MKSFPDYYNFTTLYLFPLLGFRKQEFTYRGAGTFDRPASRFFMAYLNLEEKHCIDVITSNYQDVYFQEFEEKIESNSLHKESVDILNSHYSKRTFQVPESSFDLESRLCEGKYSTLSPMEIEILQEFTVLNKSLVFLYHNYLTDDSFLPGDKDILYNAYPLLKLNIPLKLNPNINF